MRFTNLVTRTSKDTNKEDVSRNAQLLSRAGYVNRLMAGAYTYLPLGMRVLHKIENIVRDEMNAIGAQEVLMPALTPREIWETTGRWTTMNDVLFKFKGAGDRDLALGATHEEVVTPLLQQYIRSYRDLPLDASLKDGRYGSSAVYQVQTKFRNEARAKSGILRGREFRMKDMYSFHVSQADLDAFYDRTIIAYKNVYKRVGIGDITLLTFNNGGVFSKYSHEFQALTSFGEDTVYRIPGTDGAINEEILDDKEAVAEVLASYGLKPDTQLEKTTGIEVGNIFKLGTKYTDACDVKFADADGSTKQVIMGCYGLGTSRVMGTIAEVTADDKGLAWPESIAPFAVHLISLAREEADIAKVEEIYAALNRAGIETLYDDRTGVQAGERMADADLIGIPHRLVVSPKTLATGNVEWKERKGETAQLLPLDAFINQLQGKKKAA